MSIRSVFQIIAASVALCLVVSCSSRDLRIERNPAIYSALSPSDKELVERGVVEEGMSRDAVFLAWGKPDVVRRESRDGKGSETWAYVRSETVAVDPFGFGYRGYPHFYSHYGAHPRYGYCYGRSWAYATDVEIVSHIYKEVEFEKDRVTAWKRTY